MTQNHISAEAGNGPDGSIFLPEPKTLEDIDKQMFGLYQDRGEKVKNMTVEEKIARGDYLDELKTRLLGCQAITA